MALRDIPAHLVQMFIRLYGYAVSPLLGANCRFYPTCSCYAHQAVGRHGVLKGGFLAVCRILKCHPWHKGGMVDPVPATIDWRKFIGYNRPHRTKNKGRA